MSLHDRIRDARRWLIAALIVSGACLILWQATGGDAFTRYEVVEEVAVEGADDDPLAAAGFYEGTERTETQVRDEFRFGLLPAADRFPDKHLVSVATVAAPFWLLFGLALVVNRRRK